jgi:hypothetical protein
MPKITTPIGIPEISTTSVTYQIGNVFLACDPVAPTNFSNGSWCLALPNCSVSSYTLQTEDIGPSHPLSADAVRIGNSLLSAQVPESAILRDQTGDL